MVSVGSSPGADQRKEVIKMEIRLRMPKGIMLEEEPRAKKGRGRPRKNVIFICELPTAKIARSRTKEVPVVLAGNPVAKRKRGRPRKTPLPA